LLSLSILFLAPSSCAKPNLLPQYPLYVETEPQDAIVKIMNIGPTYMDGIQVKKGCHHVRVSQKGYITQDHLVTITKETNIEVKLKLGTISKKEDRKLYINTIPQNANVEIKGVPFDKGKAFSLETGKIHLGIKVSSSGYKTCHQKKVNVNVKNDLHLHVKLEKIPPKTYNLSLPLEQGKYKIAITKLGNGTEQQCFEHDLEIADQDVSLKEIRFLPFENEHTCSLKSEPIREPQPDEQQADCRLNTIGNDVKEVYIKGQHTLQFVKIETTEANNVINIALTKAQADDFFAKAKELQPKSSNTPLVPFIFHAISENSALTTKVIRTFWIQKEPINSGLYKTIISNGSSDRVSYNDAIEVINQLNEWCKDKAKFELPKEEQFVYLARNLYNPVETGNLKTCKELREKSNTDHKVKNLLGYQWQLTNSRCQIFDNTLSIFPKCNEQAYVKKGGSNEPKDATECMPEYRAESTPDMAEPNTTFRLILLEK